MNWDIVEQKNTTILKLTLILDKLFVVLEEFRQNLNDFQNNCKSIENFKNKLNFCELEVNYKTIVEEYNQNKSQIEEELDLYESTDDLSTADPKMKINEELDKNSVLNESTCNQQTVDSQPDQDMGCNYRTSIGSELSRHLTKNHLNVCHNQSPSNKNLHKHVRDFSNRKLSCQMCRFQCWGFENLERHQTIVHKRVLLNGKPVVANKAIVSNKMYLSYKCHDCAHSYRTETQLKNHFNRFHNRTYRIVKDRNFFRCFYFGCGFFDKNRSVVVEHIKSDHGKKKPLKTKAVARIKCYECCVTFESSDKLRQHLIKRHIKYIGVMSSLSNSTAHYNNTTVPTTNGRPLIDDNHKNQSINVIESLDASNRTSNGEQPITCATEDTTDDRSDQRSNKTLIFGSNLFSDLRQRKIIESEESANMTADDNQIKSNSNSQTNKSNEKLISNRRKVSNKFKCEFCAFRTVSFDILCQHMRLIHWSYRCETCSLSLRNFEKLREHQSSCFAINSFICGQNYCFFKCNDMKTLEEHQKTHSSPIEPFIVNANERPTNEQMSDYWFSRERRDQNSEEDVIFKSRVKKLIDSLESEAKNVSDPTEERINCWFDNSDHKSHNKTAHFRHVRDVCRKKMKLNCQKCHFKCWGIRLLKEHEDRAHRTSMSSTLTTAQTNEQILEQKTCYSFKNSIPKEIYDQNPTQTVINESTDHNMSDPSEAIPDNTCLEFDSTEEYIKVKSEPQDLERLSTQFVTIDSNEKMNISSVVESIEGQNQREDTKNSIQLNRSVLTIAGTYANKTVNGSEQNMSRLKGLKAVKPRKTWKNVAKSRHFYRCPECEFITPYKSRLRRHTKNIHSIYYCIACEKICSGLESFTRHNTRHNSIHDSRADNQFKCEANSCVFNCNDSQEFNEHKRQHLNANIDKIISEFQYGIKRVEIKTEIEEQTTVFVNAEQFLAQNSAQNQQKSEVSDVKEAKLAANMNQLNACLTPSAVEFPSATVRRIRGLHSAREPIRLVNKSTKKISELFKK